MLPSRFRVELAVWTHSVACDIKPELLQDMPELAKHEVGTNGTNTHTTIESITSANTEQSDESNLEPTPTAEQIEPVAVAVEEDAEKPQKPANGKWKEGLP
jgi:hypothetical protein